MLRNTLVATLAVLGLAVSSHAGVIIFASSSPTVGLPGYTTVTVSATSDNGTQIVGFDFASQPSFGFFGTLHQVNPAGLATIFQDNNGTFVFVPGSDVSQDSQFKFNRTTMTVPAGFESESNSSLRALFGSAVGLGTSTPFVQLAVPNGSKFEYNGQIQTQLGSANPVDNHVSGSIPLGGCLPCFAPQAGDELLDNVNANTPGSVLYNLQVNNGGLSTSLSNFAFDSFVPPPGGSGTGLANPATLSGSTRQFNWNTIGSTLGTYKWTYTATNVLGSDNGSLTVRITVAEPASLALVVLAVIAVVGKPSRR